MRVTAEQLLQVASHDARYELIAGEIRRIPFCGWKRGEIASRVRYVLSQHAYAAGLGELFGAETGFLIARDPDTVRAPDVAFLATENLPSVEPEDAFWPGPPDLAVEVLSPNDKTGEVDEKIQAWLAAGAKMVWIVDGRLRTVTVYRSATDVVVRTSTDELDGGDVVKGFRCRVS
ncbi:MAG: Uma2 family endonuclease, partial [Planctomycetia bacterium]|nr:Uma2 family endonuclease [Planctomycetia bacterium]